MATAGARSIDHLVYSELHDMSHRYMRRQRRGQTLQTSALVNATEAHRIPVTSTWDWSAIGSQFLDSRVRPQNAPAVRLSLETNYGD